MTFLAGIFLDPFKAVLGDISRQEFLCLLSPRSHLPVLASRRMSVMATRISLISLIFFVCTPLWIPLDAYFLPESSWGVVAVAHLMASMMFLGLTISARKIKSIRGALTHMTLMLMVPTLFYSFVYIYLARTELNWVATSFSMGYTILPFIVVAGMGVFPLTFIESLLVTLPILVAQVVATSLELPVFNWPSFIGSLWLLVLICGVSTLACCSQLALMVLLVRENIRDSLTACFSRASGRELLQFQFEQAKRNHAHLALAFLDLDHFKSINDIYGHEAGDSAIRNASMAIQEHLRVSDLLVRWGGDEFLIVLPGTTIEEAQQALERIVGSGFGMRPDGLMLTASIGVAERLADGASSWEALVEIADQCMYEAKRNGRNQMIGNREYHAPQMISSANKLYDQKLTSV